MESYSIIHLDDQTKVELVGSNNEWRILFPLFEIARTSISEGIFESKLAEAANCTMSTGNTYKVSNYKSVLYIHCFDEYAYVGTDIIRTYQNIDVPVYNIERTEEIMENKGLIFNLPENCEVHGAKYSNAKVDEVFLSMNKNTSAALDLIALLENNSCMHNSDRVIYSIEFKETGGWIHIGITDDELQIGQCIRVIAL